MNIKANLFLPVLLLCLGATANDPNEYFPVRSGMEWVMDAEFKAPDGAITMGSAIRRMGETVERGGHTYIRSYSSLMVQGRVIDEYTSLKRKSPSGVYLLHETSEERTEHLEVPLPLKVGSTWKTNGRMALMTQTLVARERVEVGGKTYEDVYHFRMWNADKSYVEDYWEAPGIGSLKAVIKMGGGTITLSLKEVKTGG